MLHKKVKKRASLLVWLVIISIIGIFLILNALNKNILYFNSPTDIKTSQDIDYNQQMRVGGMVKKNTLNIISLVFFRQANDWKIIKKVNKILKSNKKLDLH